MPSSKGAMKIHKIGQERALGVIVADSSKNCLFLRGLAPTPKSTVLSHLDPMWPPSAPNPGGCGCWCVWVRVCACVPVCPLLTHLFFFSRRIGNMQGTGFEPKRIVPALPGIAPASSRHRPDIGYLSVCVYVCVYIYMCTCVCVCMCVCVCASRNDCPSW